jgi:hypothetical protein
MTRTKFAAAVGALGLVLVCGSAQAQLYHYKDGSGRMVYSDTPPPPGTPAGNILKAPKINQAAPAPTPAAAEGAKDAKDKDGNPVKKDGPKSTADREADYKKRVADNDKKAKEDAQKAEQEQQRQARCSGLQANLSALQSGQRMRKFDANGNPSFVDDNERAAEIAKAQQEMASSKCG